ncbi:hypothetical protein Pfo_026753 [Paulownia fortunei]|nr:hypothetical protein Pfo_026753 [Paulownia fortunei]
MLMMNDLEEIEVDEDKLMVTAMPCLGTQAHLSLGVKLLSISMESESDGIDWLAMHILTKLSPGEDAILLDSHQKFPCLRSPDLVPKTARILRLDIPSRLGSCKKLMEFILFP